MVDDGGERRSRRDSTPTSGGRGGRSRGRKRRPRASRPDSAGGEGEELETELVAAMACFGAAEIDGELDGGRGELRLNLGLPLG